MGVELQFSTSKPGFVHGNVVVILGVVVFSGGGGTLLFCVAYSAASLTSVHSTLVILTQYVSLDISKGPLGG